MCNSILHSLEGDTTTEEKNEYTVWKQGGHVDKLENWKNTIKKLFSLHYGSYKFCMTVDCQIN